MFDSILLEYLKTFLTENRLRRFDEVLSNRTRHFTIAIEDVYQMHNASAIIRSCDVFGVQDAYFMALEYQKSLDKNIALGSEKWVNTRTFNNSLSCVNHLKNQGYQIIATTPHHDNCLLSEFDITKPSTFLFGTEKMGLRQETMADGFLKIPMVGFTESLNISVAAAIILEQITSRLRQSSISWQLSEEEKNIILLNWAKKSIKNAEKIIDLFNEK